MRETKGKPVPQNRFEVIASKVMQYRVREEAKVRRQETVEEGVQCFRCQRVGHYKQKCLNIKVEKERRSEEVVYAASLQKAQQEKRPVCSLWRKVQKYSGAWGMPPRSATLEQREWMTKQEVVTFVKCEGCNYKGTKTYKNQRQGFVSGEQLRNVWYNSCLKAQKWREDTAGERRVVVVKYSQCGRKDIVKKIPEKDRKKILCPECGTGKKQLQWDWRVAVYSRKGEVQQSGTRKEAPKSTEKEEDRQRDIRRIFKMLREVQLNIGIEKVDMYKGITIKVLLDNSATEMFMHKKMVAKYRFKLQKLERPVTVKNVDGTNNSRRAITHQVEVNMYYKNYIKRMRMDMCDLGKTDVILGMLWLQAHNPEINWKIEEVKITRCPPLYRKNTKLEKGQKAKKGKRVVILEEEKVVRQVVEDKENWGREKKIEADHKKIKEIVPQRFLKWRKVFEKVELERIPMRKIWDHAIDLKKTFKP